MWFLLCFIIGYLSAPLFDSFCQILISVTELCRAKVNVKIAEYNRKIQELSDNEAPTNKPTIGFTIRDEELSDDDNFEADARRNFL